MFRLGNVLHRENSSTTYIFDSCEEYIIMIPDYGYSMTFSLENGMNSNFIRFGIIKGLFLQYLQLWILIKQIRMKIHVIIINKSVDLYIVNWKDMTGNCVSRIYIVTY